jgi:glycosyltransferase involved in cell wall biosynthesis
MSRADAQATTVLEAMCWGFPVACTRESGYTDEDFFYLDLEDEKANTDQINRIQALTDNELIEISRKNRKIVETNYSWDKFLSKLELNI